MQALPVVGQLGSRLRLSPQRLRGNKALQIKPLFPREHGVHGAGQLVPEYRQGLGFAVVVFQFRKIFLAELILPQEENCRFRKGPAPMHVADLFARGPQPFVV